MYSLQAIGCSKSAIHITYYSSEIAVVVLTTVSTLHVTAVL